MSEIRSQATPASDELAETVFDLLAAAESMGEQRRNVIAHAIAIGLDDAGWSKPRTVNSAAELKALPLGSVITWLDDDEREAAVIDWEPGDGRHTASAYWMGLESMISYPATVLFTPGDAG
ncbi:hypothetical protein ACSVIA_20365 [Rhodococcus erythropolis]|uniref:hypothetical protein n=1 Tax=Rhodococcus erythropolis TaxID=1833 RepID=UPI00404295D5